MTPRKTHCRNCGILLDKNGRLGRCSRCRRGHLIGRSAPKPKRKKKVNNYDPTRPDYDWKADHFNRPGWLARWATFFGLFDVGYRNTRSAQIALAKNKKSGRVGGGFRYLKTPDKGDD